ncbi:hypothetical protein B5D80_25075 [Micromonospora wenchangensis]|uniref:HAF repeat-containing protein n=1 Tax=Micromonospora wenchangensis TaxID=1185415 RepID=A0A246RG31_9ACTN|nr:hypothetical protein [Micromonospora wenchangensis]OWV02644.1 hypothetical protein B5D80_25075 [Micromonospora wenchangensis]
MIRHRLLAAAAVGLLTAVAALPGTAPAGPRRDGLRLCALHPLPLPAGVTHGRATAVDPTGRYVAGIGTRITDGVWEPVLLLWQGARVTAVDTALAEDVVGVNSAGVVIGNAYVTAMQRPWRYQDGRLTDLPVPGNVSGAWVAGINGRGDIVGHGAVEATGSSIALRWPADRPGTVETIDTPPDGAALAVLDDGTVVGNARVSAGSSSYAGWVRRPGGQVVRLTVPGRPNAWVLAARGGWAAGTTGDDPDGDRSPVRWGLDTGKATVVDPAVEPVQDVTAGGVLLGLRAVWHADGVTPLPGAVAGFPDVQARAVTDTGTAVGWTTTDRLTPVRWTGC